MQTRVPKHSSQCGGSVLIISLVLAIILGTTLASYLYWVRTQNLLVSESQAWNAALNIAEAGIEEGMAQINVNVGTTSPLNFAGSIAANWGGTGPYTKTNADLGYSVIVSNDWPPTIYASGSTMVPLVGQKIIRTVMVTTTTNSLFGLGIATVQGINMNGQNITVDAYDSADLTKFPGGLWNSTNAFAGGDVAAEGGMADLGNANIHGRLFLAPGVGTNMGPNSLVGDMPANWPAQSGIQSADWVFNDFNKEFADVLVPYSSGLTPNQTNTGGGKYDYYLTGGNYYVSGSASPQNIFVSGVSKLYVTGDLSATSIYTTNSGSTLIVYVGKLTGSASSVDFKAVNNTGNAFNFQLFGLPTLTSLALSGNNAYVGTIYAPQCDVTLSGGGSDPFDYQGACVVRSFSSNGHFKLHYDKNLSRIGTPYGFTCASWKEI